MTNMWQIGIVTDIIVHGNPQINPKVRYIVGFLIDSDRLSYPDCKTMSATERHDEHFPL
jgi:hypothetical protein